MAKNPIKEEIKEEKVISKEVEKVAPVNEGLKEGEDEKADPKEEGKEEKPVKVEKVPLFSRVLDRRVVATNPKQALRDFASEAGVQLFLDGKFVITSVTDSETGTVTASLFFVAEEDE